MLYNLVVKRACQKLELLSEVFGSATDALCYFRHLSPYPSLSLEDKGKVTCACPGGMSGLAHLHRTTLQLVLPNSGSLECNCCVFMA